jgi:hypothetical protein
MRFEKESSRFKVYLLEAGSRFKVQGSKFKVYLYEARIKNKSKRIK